MRKRKAVRLPRETRRQQILEAARVEFEEHGYLEAKVSRIAGQLGVVEGTVYRYFPSKRALLETLIADWYEQQTQRQREGLAGLRAFREKLRFVARQHLLTLVENAAFCAVLLKESRGQGGNLAIMVRQMNREYSQSLTQLVAEGLTSGQLRPLLPARLLHHLLYGALEQLFWDHFQRPRELELDTHNRRIAGRATHGLRRHRAAPGPRPRSGPQGGGGTGAGRAAPERTPARSLREQCP